ncbi:UPF0481 protein At3g47200-like [Abrus precatorius]|uniref:UPF0481 protein At3g47200-like n=1 Tax=Abrus precatorius TaxID=3816 RepID=A0A8B8JU20_ABRPR|nr:UPF0481 protein At3g47200-like [Abrus precatorius]
MASSATSYSAVPEEPQIHHIIVIPEKIEAELHDGCCIYKVPPNLRKLKDGEAYTPELISIGPFHHNKPELKPMHKQKQRYFLAFWERVTNKKALAKYKAFLNENIGMIRSSYSEPDKLDDDKFVEMILLDSIFILELFLRKSEQSAQEKDYMLTTSWICKSIQRDLLLLENQLPIFVLEELYKRVYKLNSLSFLELAFNYFEDYYPHKSTSDQNNDMVKNFKSCKHFTDLIRFFFLPEKVHAKEWNPSEHFTLNGKHECVLKTATKLNEAGVSFEKVHHRNLLDIKFKKIPVLSWFLCLGCLPCSKWVKARFQIPQLEVLQTTECVLRNLIAFEQCHYSDQPFMCNYVSLIDSLINTKEDVELLVDKEIIVHELGCHKELATMINGLCKNVVVNCNYYGKISRKINDHYNSCWKHYMGMLRSVYFRDPWRLSSTIVGVVIFLFAIVNFLRVTGLYHPKY